MIYYSYIETPIGFLTIGVISSEDKSALARLSFGKTEYDEYKVTEFSENVEKQLSEYFDGERIEFDIPVEIDKKGYAKDVLWALPKITYGTSASYKKLAELSGNPNACRAVGNIIHNNPISIIIPCHRIIRSDGNIGGFAADVKIKQYLLDMEKKYSKNI